METPTDTYTIIQGPHETNLLCEYLSQFITENKRTKIEAALRHRTRHLTIVLEDIYQPHNASAVLRTCECLGIQDIHIIENRNRYRPNPGVVMGSNKWLSLFYYSLQDKTDEQVSLRMQKRDAKNTKDCLQGLKEQGYQIVATSPHRDARTPADLPLEKPLAILFGSEEPGLSQAAFEEADAFLRIPMYGFTESYNISVSAALILGRLTERLHASGLPFTLSKSEIAELRLEWYRRIVKRHELLEKKFWEEVRPAQISGASASRSSTS